MSTLTASLPLTPMVISVPAAAAPRKRRSRLAWTGVFIGVVSFPIWIVTGFATPLLGVFSVVLGLWAAMRIRRNPLRISGKWLAANAMAIGFLNLVLVAVPNKVMPRTASY